MTRAITDMMGTLSLSDGWRIYDPTTKKYTWCQGISPKRARLDFFLCNDELLSILRKFDIDTKYRSDHSPISCTIKLSEEKRGPGVWRFNNSLLQEQDFIALIKKEINNFKEIYAASPYNPDYISSLSHGFEIMISPSLFWETLLATLRGTIIYYSKKRKAAKNRRQKTLEQNIKVIDKKANSGIASAEDLTKLSSLNEELIECRKEELRGAYVRSRADWLKYGEKPSRYFLNLENRNRINKNISEILLEDKTTINNQTDILNTVKQFYEDLYSSRHLDRNTDQMTVSPTQLTNSEREFLETPIT